jgi:type I restriction enzyme M protein
MESKRIIARGQPVGCIAWQFGLPPQGNANFAWVQYFIHHLATTGMATGNMSSNQSGEGDI